jgi:hypothetical protein
MYWNEFAVRDGFAQPQPPIMTSFWAIVKVEFYHRYLWPTKAAAIGDGARAKCSKRPASLWIQDEPVPLGSVVAVVLAESPDHHARDQNILHTAGDLVAAHQFSSGA